jgi:hypothetical protein
LKNILINNNNMKNNKKSSWSELIKFHNESRTEFYEKVYPLLDGNLRELIDKDQGYSVYWTKDKRFINLDGKDFDITEEFDKGMKKYEQ